MKSFKEFISEDGAAMVGGSPVNNVSGGDIAGLGVDNPSIANQAEPGVNKKKKKNPIVFKDMIARKLPVITKT